MTRQDKDLRHPISNDVQQKKIQKIAPMFYELDGIIYKTIPETSLYIGSRLISRLEAELGWFEGFIRHAPSIGTFYEDTLRQLITDFLPSTYKIGTGFVYDAYVESASKQVDILVYDDRKIAPYYKSGMFSIIRPEETISVSEVKKNLKKSDLKKIILETVGQNFGGNLSYPKGCFEINVFGFSSSMKTETIVSTIIDSLNLFLDDNSSMTCSGDFVGFGVEYITLPNIFLFDRSYYIKTRLEKLNNIKYRVVIDTIKSPFNKVINEYIENMLGTSSSFRPNYMTPELRMVCGSTTLEKPVFLFYRMSMQDLAQKIMGFEKRIKELKIIEKSPYEIIIPSSVDLNTFEELVDLTKKGIVTWCCLDM